MKKFILTLIVLSTTIFISSCTVRTTTYDTTRTTYVAPSPVVWGYPSTYYYSGPTYQRRSSVWFSF